MIGMRWVLDGSREAAAAWYVRDGISEEKRES
jgi:hypothetical protein